MTRPGKADGKGTITLAINGQTVQAPSGTTVLEAALQNGIYIPHLCDHENLRHTANCRLCMVKVAGRDGVVASCSTPAEEGMQVDTNDELAEKVRKLSVDFMFKTHPNECTGCPKYGRCQLQSISQAVGDTGRALRSNPIRLPADVANPMIMHEMYRCILCGRCVRACKELRGVGVLDFEKVNGRMRVVVRGESLEKADCRFCGACIEVCPTGAIREQEELAQKMEGKTRQAALLPCQDNCPAHIDIPKYLRFIREENYPAAVAVVREKAPLPHSLGYICNHKCESGCRRAEINDSVAIRDLKRLACEHDDGSWKAGGFKKPATGKSVAVLGSGPAGLTAGYYLAKLGHKVTIFEALEKAGGMMRYGIPGYRLPRDILDAEIAEIAAAGVHIKTGERVENPGELLQNGYDAVLLATGAHDGVRLPLTGNDLEGVLVNADFLRAAEEGNPLPVGEKVVVLGGGNVAMDCAGVAKRLGAKEVHALCLETREAMTASDEERELAEEEGLVIHNAKTFLEITGENGKVSGLRYADVNKFYFDENGQPVLEIAENSEKLLEADTVIFATGQRPQVPEGFGVETGRGNRIVVKDGCAAGDGLFAAGDAVTGTDSVIAAIQQGRSAAEQVDKYLGGEGDISETLAPEQLADPRIGAESGFGAKARVAPRFEPAETRCQGFAPIDHGYDVALGQCEASRCLQCDLRLQIAPQKFWSDYEKGKEGDSHGA